MNDATGSGGIFLTGSYTIDGSGTGDGIGAVVIDTDGTVRRLGAAASADVAPSPSFIARHPTLPVVYAVAEFGQTVRAFRLGENAHAGSAPTLEPLGDPWPAGGAACHVAVDPAARYIVVSCWGDGKVVLYELDDAGAITTRFEGAVAADPYHDPTAVDPEGRPRQTRAHEALILPDGAILTTDIGFDLLRAWSYRPGAGLVLDHELALPEGGGPRHMVRHPSGHIYIVTEYSIEVFVVARDTGTGELTLLGRTPATVATPQPHDAGSEITLDASGRHVHVTVRFSNVLSTLDVLDAGARLKPVGDVDCGGDVPRFHLERGEWLYVTNLRSNAVSTFRVAPETGLPTFVGNAEVASPTCLLPLG